MDTKKTNEVINIVNESQTLNKSKQLKLIDKLMTVFKKMPLEDFTIDFMNCVKICFLQEAYSGFCTNTVNFLVRFVIKATKLDSSLNLSSSPPPPPSSSSVSSSTSEQEQQQQQQQQKRYERKRKLTVEEPDLEKSGSTFFRSVIDFITMMCEQNGSTTVRMNMSRFVAKLLKNIGQDVAIDNSICDRLTRTTLKQMHDKNTTVRVLAINASFKLQDNRNPNCPVIKKFLYHLEYDPSAEVRQAVLNKIALTKDSLKIIIDRTRDHSARVRNTAYTVLTKVGVTKLSIACRVALLVHGLKDEDENVRETVENQLLPAWFNSLKADYVLFLEAFDICMQPIKVIETALLELFKTQSRPQIVQQLKRLQNDDNIIPYDRLTPEISFFWRSAVLFINNVNGDNDDDDDNDESLSRSSEDYVVFPTLSSFCSLIAHYHYSERDNDTTTTTTASSNSSSSSISSNSISNSNRIDSVWKAKEKEFILNQLLTLCKWNNIHDDVYGRNGLTGLLLDLLKSRRIAHNNLPAIIELYFYAERDTRKAVNDIVGCVIWISFANAATMHNGRQKLSEEIARVINAIDNSDESIEQQQQMDDRLSLKNATERLGTTVATKCLKIIREMMLLKRVARLTPLLRWLFDAFVIPYYFQHKETVSEIALEIMASYCLKDLELAKKYFLMFCVEICNDKMYAIAVRAVFDLLFYYKPTPFISGCDNIDDLMRYLPVRSRLNVNYGGLVSDDDNDNERGGDGVVSGVNENNNENDNQESTTNNTNVIEMLIDLLEESNEKMRIAALEGILKLVYHGILKSPNLIARLIITWFRPENLDCAEIQRYFSFFFTFYACKLDENRALVAMAFMPTMRELFRAPLNSSFGKIDQDDVAKLIITILHPKLLPVRPNEDPINQHNNLAVWICEEILTTQNNSDCDHAVLCRALVSLSVSFHDDKWNDQIVYFLNRVKKKVDRYSNRTCVRNVCKFHVNVIKYTSGFGGADGDGDLHEKEETTAANNAEQSTDDSGEECD